MWPPKEEFWWPSKMPFDLFQGTTMWRPTFWDKIWFEMIFEERWYKWCMLKYDEMWCETQQWSRCLLDGKPWPWRSPGPLVPSRLCYHAGGLRGALHHYGAPWATQDRAILHHLQGTAGHKMLQVWLIMPQHCSTFALLVFNILQNVQSRTDLARQPAVGTFHFQPCFLHLGRFHLGWLGLGHSPAALSKGELPGRHRRDRRGRRDQSTDHHHLVIAGTRDPRDPRDRRLHLGGRWSWSCFTGLHITGIAGQIELLLMAWQPRLIHMTQVAQNVKSKKNGWWWMVHDWWWCKFMQIAHEKPQGISKCVSHFTVNTLQILPSSVWNMSLGP